MAAIRHTSPLRIWMQWDARWYLGIAEHGYHWGIHGKSALAFFPLYPFLVHLCMTVGIDGVVAGLLVANAAFGAALLYLYVWIVHSWDEVVARRAVWLVVLFPAALFTTAPYSESLFLLCLTGAFTAGRSRRPVWAGIFSAGALLARSAGIAVLPAMLLLLRPRTLREWIASVGPSLLAGAIWVGYLYGQHFGVPDVLHAQRAWHRGFAPPWTGFAASIHWLVSHGMSNVGWVAENLLGVGMTVFFLALTAWAWREMSPAARVYCALFWAIVLLSPEWLDDYYAPFSSVDRFVLTLLPLAPWAASRLRHHTFTRLTIAFWALLTTAATVYLSGGWVG